MLRRLPREIATASLKTAVLAGAKALEEEAKRSAPFQPGPTAKTRLVRSAILGSGRRRHRVKLNAPQRVRYDYGHLRDNIRHKRFRSDLVRAAVLVGIGRAFWGRFLEGGTRRMRPHTWWAPALKRGQGPMVQAMAQTLVTALRRHVTRLAGKAGK